MTDTRIQYTEKMVGAGHPSLADTLNRLALVEHNNDGTHKYPYVPASEKGAASGVAELDASSLIILGRLPAVLTGKDADSVDGFHGSSLAKAGANSDITALSGLTTPLSRVQGGTGYVQAVAPVFASQNTASSITGSLAETTLFSAVIPGGTLGANGVLKVLSLWTHTNSANLKTLKVKFGGVSFLSFAPSTAAVLQTEQIIRNRNNVASQVAHINSVLVYGASAAANITASVDTSVDQTLVLTGQLANAGETITLESVIVEVLK